MKNVNKHLVQIETLLLSIKGILDVKWLDSEAKKKALEFEEKLRNKGLSEGIGSYYNEGVVDVLSKHYICVVLNNNEFRHATQPSLFWIAGDIVIGEEVTDPIRLQVLKQKGNIKMLKKNFILHIDRIKKARGKAPVFVIRALPFPELEGIEGFREILSASPIGLSDIYFKKRFGWDTDARDLGTILIGFNPNVD